MAGGIEKFVNQWDFASWVKKSEDLRGAVELEGALFAHSDTGRVYFMSEASGSAVRFDLSKSDIVDATENGKSVSFGAQTFNGVRITLKLDALVNRVSIHQVSGLVETTDRSIMNVAGDAMRIKNTVLASVVMR